MNSARLPALVYFLLLIMGVLQWVNAYPQLPVNIASHFTADGTPNGWQPKQFFFLMTSIVIAVTAIPTFFAARRIRKRDPEKINLPNKAYWLAPEHREDTWRYISTFMAWFGCGVLFVLLYGISQAINYNLPNIHRFDSQGMLFVLGGFLLYVIVSLILFVCHFRNVPDSYSSSVSGSSMK